MPLLETKGAGSAQGFGLSLGSAEAVYIEDVFSTYLYTGNSSTQTITNGIDLAGEGGLVWVKSRSNGGARHHLTDTVRGATNSLKSDDTAANEVISNGLTSFTTSGFSLGANGNFNFSGENLVSWTFRKKPKFFDIVTYTGTGTDPLTLSHNLQSVPGVIIIKCTSTVTNWRVHSTALDATLVLNLTNAAFIPDGLIKNLTSTTFQVNNSADVNSSGATYVAYLFAHNAGGFGLTGLDNVISCGSFTTDGSGDATVSLGYEPQLVLMKYSSQSSDWMILDNMRGFRVTGNSSPGNSGLFPNLSNAESTSNGTISTYVDPNATGFTPIGFGPSKTVIYIAIRRGPMKVPTSGTSVFSPAIGPSSGTFNVNAGWPGDVGFLRQFSSDIDWYQTSRLTNTNYLSSTSTAAEAVNGLPFTKWDNNTAGFLQNTSTNWSDYVAYAFRRAPGFFDVVCYTGTGSARTVTHNLAAVPELMIMKRRSGLAGWPVYVSSLGPSLGPRLNGAEAAFWSGSSNLNSTAPTSSVFTVGVDTDTNASGSTYVAYLFATCPGVSKVGSYTGTGTTLQINCGFTGGARFVLIKRTDSTGDWYVWDSARGIIAGNDPYLLLNSTAAEVTSTDYVDTYSLGFEISSTAPAAINASAGTFIFLAIA